MNEQVNFDIADLLSTNRFLGFIERPSSSISEGKLLPIPTAVHQTMKAATPEARIVEAETYHSLLPKLGSAIDNCLAAWETYFEEIGRQPAYETIVSSDSIDTTTKAHALGHLLLILPLRHAALVKSCTDPDIELVELPEQCDVLLQELLAMDKEMDFDALFGFLAKNKKFVARAVKLENGIRQEEMFRKQQLSRLKGLHLSLTYVREDGALAQQEVEALVDAMEALGVSLVGVGLFSEAEELGRVRGICGA